MSAEVEIQLAVHENALTIPVAAIVETDSETLCWVRKESHTERRVIELGDSNDVYVVVENGLEEGDEVVLNPRAFIEEAKNEVMETIDESQSSDGEAGNSRDSSQTAPKTDAETLRSRPKAEEDSAP